jgi:3-dehydroquinate dehydratase II
MAKPVYVLNGPNLNMLGSASRHLWEHDAGRDRTAVPACAKDIGLTIDFRQSNHEGVLVDWIQEAGDKATGIVINPGAYGHTSIALHDAIRAVAPLKVVEVHISNIHAREPFRHRSMIAPAAAGMICGLGPRGYAMALQAFSASDEAQER